jgi:hypothetical protein
MGNFIQTLLLLFIRWKERKIGFLLLLFASCSLVVLLTKGQREENNNKAVGCFRSILLHFFTSKVFVFIFNLLYGTHTFFMHFQFQSLILDEKNYSIKPFHPDQTICFS